MPIYFAEPQQEVVIRDIKGSDKIKTHLQNLGFVVGETVTVVNKVNDNLIVKLKGISFALSHDLANRIIV